MENGKEKKCISVSVLTDMSHRFSDVNRFKVYQLSSRYAIDRSIWFVLVNMVVDISKATISVNMERCRPLRNQLENFHVEARYRPTRKAYRLIWKSFKIFKG